MMNKLNFSGHETFPLRQLWLYKAHSLLQNSSKPFTKEADSSIAEYGLGKNMLKSMGYWIQTAQLYSCDHQGNYTPTEFASILFDKDHGDPYLEKIESLWLLHLYLSTNQYRSSCIYWLFNINNQSIFNFDDFKRGIVRWVEIDELETSSIPSDTTLKKDFNLSVSMYCSRGNREDFEDAVHYPFWTLGLIKTASEVRQSYLMSRRNLADIPMTIFITSFLRYLEFNGNPQSVSFENLLSDRNSPGRILLLNEHPLRIYLEGIEKELEGAYVFDDTAGQRMVYQHRKLSVIEYVKDRIYA